MTLYERLYDDMKHAMKAHDEVRLSVIRLSIAACKNYKIEKYGVTDTELSDEEVLQVLTKQVKQRKDAASAYTAASRNDLAEKEQAEAAIIHGYLPPQMTEAEMTQVVLETKAALGVSSPPEMGKLMSAVMAKLKGKADGSDVQRLVKQALTG